MREVSVLDAPSNLGLRPPGPGVVPGCYKLAGALRDCGLIGRLGAEDAGCVTPPRYDRHDWKPGDGVANAAGLVDYTPRLADRVGAVLDADRFAVVLGGDCSILLGATLALRRRGRYGLAFFDGHSDFRHPDNSSGVGSAAGEDLALVTGRGQLNLTDLEGYRPYIRDEDVVVVGIRDDDQYLEELHALEIATWPVAVLREDGMKAAAAAAAAHLEQKRLDGFWIHLDADILDPTLMPAVDSPDPGGIEHRELVPLLAVLLASPRCVGLEVTVFDPDLDPDGRLAGELTDTLVATFEAAPASSGRAC
jgi:arginase